MLIINALHYTHKDNDFSNKSHNWTTESRVTQWKQFKVDKNKRDRVKFHPQVSFQNPIPSRHVSKILNFKTSNLNKTQNLTYVYYKRQQIAGHDRHRANISTIPINSILQSDSHTGDKGIKSHQMFYIEQFFIMWMEGGGGRMQMKRA